jgi:hypothetical protein
MEFIYAFGFLRRNERLQGLISLYIPLVPVIQAHFLNCPGHFNQCAWVWVIEKLFRLLRFVRLGHFLGDPLAKTGFNWDGRSGTNCDF